MKSTMSLLEEALDADLAPRDREQISHGLNLVLRLKSRLSMPIVLAEIRSKQRKIDAGLGELNFVHFARFLPTHDNTALQVITEFDGPLAPYVLDFAIEIGDVFDTLLSHTKGTEKIVPIAKHAAEFLAFVEKNNTVTVLPLPGGRFPDWPLYAAYPGQTVLDIIGPRADLPIPKADRRVTEVARDDLQGNVLRGYGATRVTHFVLRVVDPRQARKWLANKASRAGVSSNGVPPVTSYKHWDKGAKPLLMLNIGLTYAGMKALGIREKWLATFPEAFVEGALTRAESNFDVGRNAPAHWRLGGPAEAPNLHVMVSLYDGGTPDSGFDKAVLALIASLPAGGLALLATHDAAYNGGRSWFGYADGIAKPRIAATCPIRDRDYDLQPAATAGEFVLGSKYCNVYGGDSLGALPAALATNGTFCAVRVLAEDTDAFAATLKAEATRLSMTADQLAAKIMGRWYDGAPLSLYPDAPDAAGNSRNDFDYAPSYEYPATRMDHVGERCPVGAHIRRANPRTARVAGARYVRRLMRRGMHYEIKNEQGQRVEVGLFGMFICADLERQFEFIQRQWINGDRFSAGLRGTRDPLVGTSKAGDDEFEIPVPNGPPARARLPQFVHTKGSVYLFMPGLEALRQLDQFATTSPPSRSPVAPPPAPSLEMIESLLEQLEGEIRQFDAGLTKADLLNIALASIGKPAAAKSAGFEACHASSFGLVLDPRRRDFQIDPYPVYAAFRAREPVYCSALFRGWFIFGYDDVVRVCTEDNNFSAAEIGSHAARGLFTLDNPEHNDVLAKVVRAWKAGAVDTAKFVDRSIARTLGPLDQRPCFDLVDDFARPVPRDVYFDILGGAGIDAAARVKIDGLARTVMKHHDRTMDFLQGWDGLVAGVKLAARLAVMLIEARGSHSRYAGSFLAFLAREVQSGGPLSLAVAVMTLVNLTVAGYMSVEFLLATGIRRLLLDDAAWWGVLRQKPGDIGLFLEEMRRTDHALSVIERFAKQDVVVSGVTIRKGSLVLGVLASANRDAAIFGADAEEFRPYRDHKQQLGLGWGTHWCMGRFLEPLITRPAIDRLMGAMPSLRLQSTAQPPWFENFYFRSFDNLAVTTLK